MTRFSLNRQAIDAVASHAAVQSVRLVGSRATGTATDVSDWDVAVETDDFPAVARDIRSLLAPLEPLVQQWDRLSETQCWMAILPGPEKLDLIFDEPHRAEPAWRPQPDNLGAIDAHFWDWTLWLSAKRAIGRSELASTELREMFDHILRPMGVEAAPGSLDTAVGSYLSVRAWLESDFGVTVPRSLEREVLRAFEEHRGSELQ